MEKQKLYVRQETLEGHQNRKRSSGGAVCLPLVILNTREKQVDLQRHVNISSVFRNKKADDLTQRGLT